MAKAATNKNQPATSTGGTPGTNTPAGNANNASTQPGGTTTKPPRIAPVLAGDVLPANVVPMPTRTVNRGSKTNYPFTSLANVGDSFGVKNKTAADIQAIIANQNRKLGEIKKDANGLPIPKKNSDGSVKYQEVEMKDVAGAVIGKMPGSADNGAEIDYERYPQKKFFALDVNPATDPQTASVRVWREA